MIPMFSNFSSPSTIAGRLPQPAPLGPQTAFAPSTLQFGKKPDEPKNSENPIAHNDLEVPKESKRGKFLGIAALEGALFLGSTNALAHGYRQHWGSGGGYGGNSYGWQGQAPGYRSGWQNRRFCPPKRTQPPVQCFNMPGEHRVLYDRWGNIMQEIDIPPKTVCRERTW
ncbi:MAG TPA: hypothetical protein V6C52_13320 [Coleofasciculaceae cyanobacterium]|jgi:hypothetical protein